MDLSTGRRVSYNIDSLLGPSTSHNDAADDNTRPITCDGNNFATFAPGNTVC